MGLGLSRAGYVVFNISYRLAPRAPFPAALEDTCAALEWVAREAPRYGGDPSRVAFAGESAGANLVTSLALATSYERPEPFARAAFDTNVVPRAVVAACGMLQVTDPDRFRRRRIGLSALVQDRIQEVTRAYIGARDGDDGSLDLADPLIVLERRARPSRPLPPFFACVGTRDPLLDDTRRLGVALHGHRIPYEIRYYPGELHAFHAAMLTRQARSCWAAMLAFLDRHV
jgi:acetyl esterase